MQNDIEHLEDLVKMGLLSADQANVELVKAKRFKLVTGSIPRGVRSALNAAVKNGELKRMSKDGHKPECYYAPDFEHLAKKARRDHEVCLFKSLSGVYANH